MFHMLQVEGKPERNPLTWLYCIWYLVTSGREGRIFLGAIMLWEEIFTGRIKICAQTDPCTLCIMYHSPLQYTSLTLAFLHYALLTPAVCALNPPWHLQSVHDTHLTPELSVLHTPDPCFLCILHSCPCTWYITHTGPMNSVHYMPWPLHSVHCMLLTPVLCVLCTPISRTLCYVLLNTALCVLCTPDPCILCITQKYVV